MDCEINYTAYLNIPATPAGAVLAHILRRLGIARAKLARAIGLVPRRVYALINGKSRFTPEISLSIERFLNIGQSGFFYQIQSNHDIYEALKKGAAKPDLSQFEFSTFWDVDIEKINWEKSRDWVIRRVVEYGQQREMVEICRFYGKEQIAKVAKIDCFRLKERAQRNLSYLSAL